VNNKKNEEQEGKIGLFLVGGATSGRGEGIRKGQMRANVVDVFCFNI
jgi:hypothetical protein